MAFVAVYDANVLYPSTLRDVLIRVAQAGLVQAKWTDQILDETFRNLKENRPDLDPTKLDLTRERMSGAIRDVLVKGYEPLIDILDLPDPDDRHVLAAAIRAKAQVIVTFNAKDFPADKLAPWDVQAVHPDAFIEAQVDLSPRLVYAELQRIADSWRYPPNAVVGDVIASLERDGLVASAAALRALT
ncbi:PIN domain-containing protein [Streptomyces griseoruber]|uniref:Toxin-antitoxin system, toxin component, PIN family protein n=1 Tax=Streptomyces griseoruber TaxID=1943 RepID=A0A101SST3_9ACTN|nr:PIN domain-containing protein [Streptomyces griseoruber]KUN79279.1 toxin-antitoxin system, toxin component, PIN family protein [Streptomyces griseoruber]